MSTFRELMIELDMALTGKDRRAAEHTARQLRDGSPPHGIYYLSDGGYSRVVVRPDGQLWPTSNSLDRVKLAWGGAEARRIAAAVSDLITKEDRQ